MSRRTRKKKAMKKYNYLLAKKGLSVIQLYINTKKKISDLVAEGKIWEADIIRKMAEVQGHLIQSQIIPKPDKYGKVFNYTKGSIVLPKANGEGVVSKDIAQKIANSVESNGKVTSPCDEIIEIITREEKG